MDREQLFKQTIDNIKINFSYVYGNDGPYNSFIRKHHIRNTIRDNLDIIQEIWILIGKEPITATEAIKTIICHSILLTQIRKYRRYIESLKIIFQKRNDYIYICLLDDDIMSFFTANAYNIEEIFFGRSFYRVIRIGVSQIFWPIAKYNEQTEDWMIDPKELDLVIISLQHFGNQQRNLRVNGYI